MAYSITNGVVENGIILENDTMTVLDGGTAISTTVNAGGRITVSEGGTANCTAINAGGELYVSSGGTATGKMTFEKGATVSAYADAIFDFDLTQAEVGAGDALVNDLSIIQGTPTCTLTVNEEQGKGVYTLAGGAAGFDKTVTVQNTLGESLGTLTVDGTLETDNRRYTLNLTDDILSLTCYALFHDRIIGNETVSVTEYEIYENPTINPDGKLRVSSGGTANDTTLNGGGMYVSSGGTANDTTLNTGSIYVSSGGTANDTTLNGGSMYVSSGGTANNMAISSGGKFSVSGSGTANNIEVYCGGSLSVGKDGTAANIKENGGNVVAKDGANVTFQANTFSAVTLNDKTATATVHSGTTAASTTVNAGLLAVYSGGIASSATVNSGGTLFISSGGTANDTRIGFSGRMVISSGGVADIINATSNGTVTVLNGGVVNTAYVRADGKILISSGGKLTGKLICLGGVISAASDTIVDFDLTRTLPGAAPLFMFDSYNCLIKGTPTYTITVNSDQAEGIYSLYDYINNYYKRELCHQITVQNTEGTVLGTLSVGETITVSDTAYTLNLSDSLMFLQIGENITPSPYTSDGVVVYTERSATVSSGEIYHDTEIWGGQLYVLSGGTADIVSVHPFSRGSVFISSGGTANSVMVNSFCSMFVSTGGTVRSVEIKSGGELRVSSGGTATEVKEDGGYVSVADGADVTFTPNTINGLLLENASATVHSGTTANSTTLNNTSTHLFISSGGTANGTKINSGWVYVSRGGKANSTAIIKGTREVGGAMFVSSGGVADDTTIEGGGWLDVSSGGVANNTMVNASMFVYTGGTANGVTVSSNGFLHVGFSSGNWFESGGTVNDAVVSGGSMNVAYGGVANKTTVSSNGKLNVFSRGRINSTTVNSGGALFIYSSSVANSITINSGTMRISGGGKASGINVSGGEVFVSIGGVANDVMANSGGKITVSSGGTVNDAVVSGGSMLILSGGLADNTTLNSDGALSVGNGGKLTGKMTFETGADVSMTGKAILDFDLTQAEAGAADALVNDLSIIQGTPIYTLTVDADLWKPGTYDYLLAEGASEFNSTISVMNNTTGETLETLKIGEKVMIGYNDYTLNLDEGALSLTVEVPDVTAPVITLTADTETVVLQTTLTATVDDGSTIQYRIGEFGLWKEYKEPIIASLNETYYFMAMDDAGNIGTNQITFGNIDTSGVLLSTLWSQRGINPMGGNTTIMYNEYTPLDPSVTPEAHCLTGCVNTAAGQLIYYFIEKGWLDLPLTLEEKDEYTSKHKATTEGGDAIVIPVKSDGSTPGTLSFAEINAMLSDFQLDSAEHAAALLYAIGVVLESKYSASSTGTSWNRVFFKRAGFEGETMGGPYFGEYYWGDMDDEMQYTITDAGFEVLIENLEAGLPVGATYPGHAFVIDGYDRESDTFHINLGWGGNQATRWYTRDEMQEELNCEYFVYDLNPEYVETFTVTDARVYGTGTMIRAFEQAAGMIGDNTVAFDPSVAGKTVELLNHITFFDEVISVKDFNMNVLVTESQGGENSYGFYADHIDVIEPSDPVTVLTFHASGGSLIVSTEEEFNYAFQMEEALSCTVDADGMLIYGGKTSEGTDAAAVLQALQTCRSENTEVSGDLLDPNGWSYNGSAGEDVFRLSNSSLSVGNVSLGDGDDVLSLTGRSKLYGSIDAGDGSDSITIDSTSSASGDLTGKCNLHFVLAERDDHAMFTIQSSASGLCTDATISVDMKKAEIGTYTLISAAPGATGITDLRDLAITVTGSGEADFTLSVNGTSTSDYADLIFEDNALKLQVKKEPVKPKWTYLVYMAADNDLCYSALYDIVSMQQAKVDSQIDIYVLADRTPAGTKGSGDYETINGTYKWGSDWEDTRVGKITYNPGLTVTVDWESWGELDTGSFETLERFVNWVQEESPAENYGLMLWDHGAEDATLCYDLTTDPDWDACFTVPEVSGLLKEKGNIPLVIFNACLLGSELVATQLAGNTDVIVVSEPSSYGQSTFNYSMFFRTITPDMTPQEMAAIMVRNVEPQSEYTGEPSMLSAVDVTDSRLGDALEALAGAVAAGNDVDKDVLIHAMLQASQDGSAYDGTNVEQSDLGFMIRDVMADPDYGNTSEGFRKALADVKTALEAVVLEYRSVPAKRGSGIAVCNSVYTAKILMTSGLTLDAIRARISSYLTSTYDSNPLWGGLLNDLCATYLAEIEAGRVPTAVFSDSEVVVDGRTVTVSDLGGFSGRGELFDCIKLRDERFFGFAITAADKSTGSFTITNDAGAAITVSLLAADGTEVATGTGSVSFQDLAVGTYYLRIQSETDCRVTLSTDADWWTGVDRFEGNDSYETAAAMEEGYHTGLITCEGDPDYYLIGNYDALLYTIEVYGEEGWTVGEYDPYDDFLYEADYADGKYTMMMGAMGYLLVEGTADLATGGDAYSVNVIPFESEWPDDVTLDDLVGTKDGVSWESSVLMNKYTVECSPDSFEHTMRIVTTGTAVDMLNLPSGTYQWRVTADSGKNPEWFDGEEIVSEDTTAAPKVFRSSSDANDDLFFATPVGTWDSRYCAKHVGSVGDWTGTNELVSAAGKGRIQDLFFGSADPGTLYLTDSDNGDALFLDDVYTGLPEEIEENTARLFRLRKIIAGTGDDIVDMTSQRFEYTGGALTISGGDGDDVIWANRGSRNSLFGDAGNDRITGASGDDVIVGGIGNDRMHGGGGDDIFTFCDNWGIDMVEQLETGTVTLWFISGSMENWNSETLTYSDGENSVTVSGVSADQVSLKFEYGGSRLFASLINMGAFSEFTTRRIFDESTSVSGILANS